MGFKRAFVIFTMLLACTCPAPPTALAGQASGAGGTARAAGDGAEMIQPSDLFPDFPALEWGMSFREAAEAVEKAGVRTVIPRRDETQFTWDGKFGGMDGRATVLFKKGSGVYEVAVIVYALDKRQEVFAQFSRKISDRHGDAKEVSDTGIDTSKLWRLKNGFAVELRLIKDDDSPVVDVHWVKE